MKLLELQGNLNDIQDPRDGEEANFIPINKDSIEVDSNGKKTPPRNSNIGKAKRIANRVKMKKRESNPDASETPSQSSLGGHGSTFLFR